MSWPVVVKTEPQVDCVLDELLSEWELMKITDVSRDIRCSPDAVPVMLTSHLVVDESPDEEMAGWPIWIVTIWVLVGMPNYERTWVR